ncbi:TPA: homoserine kinase, partial [Candidatus Bathyarchaeota archaeon]|nr:homoserine kinase [Candidatus Bathyarchaeota archaeon]
VIVCSYEPLRMLTFPPPDLHFAIAVPVTLRGTTREARAVLPRAVGLRRIVRNIGGAASVVAGILTSDPDVLGQGMLADAIVETARAKLYPSYWRVRGAALAAGASGVAFSGAGPAMIAVVDPARADPGDVAEAMREAFGAEGVEARAFRAKPAAGARVLG